MASSNLVLSLVLVFLIISLNVHALVFLTHRSKKIQPASSRLLLSLKTTTVDIVEDAPRDIFTFDGWARTCGIQQCDGFQLTTTTGGMDDVSVTTNKDLAANSPILFVPNDLIWTGSKIRDTLGVLEAAEQQLSANNAQDRLPYFYLFVNILKEYEMGQESPWYTWFNALPRIYCNGASMTDFCLGCLPPYAASLARQEKRMFHQFLSALGLVPFFDNSEIKKNKDLAKWAFSVVNIRSLELPNGDVSMVPMVDMFTYGSQPEAYITFDEQSNACAYAAYDIPAGCTLRVSQQSDTTNPSKMLARYGCFDDTTPAQFCKLIIEDPSPELIQLGYDPSRMLFYHTGDIAQEVWDVMLFKHLEASNCLEEQRFLYQAHMTGDVATKQQLHQRYFPQTLQALKRHVCDLLLELEELSETSWRKTSRHPRHPLLLRHNEFVRDTFERVQEKLETMG